MINFDPTQIQTNLQKYVDTLLTYDNKRVSDLQSQQSTLQQKSSAVSSIISALSALSSSMNISFNTLSTTSSNASVATATASGKLNGNIAVNVNRLASFQVLDWTKLDNGASDAFHYDGTASASSSNFWGSLVGTTFTLKLNLGNGSTENINVDLTKYDGNSTISQVLDDFIYQVNAQSQNIRLYKQKLNDGTFAVQSSALSVGKNSALSSITINDTSFNNGANLDDLNAQFSVNGYDYTRSSNSFSDIIPNLTVTLNGTGSAVISVKNDTSSISQGISNFVQAFKNFSDKARSLTSSDPSNQGILSSDVSTIRQVMDSIRSKLMNPRTVIVDGVAYNFNPSQIGISFDQYGAISFDSSKLSSYLSSNVKGSDILKNWWTSVQSDVQGYITKGLSSNGIIGKLQSNYSNSIKTISDQLKELNDEINNKREVLIEQVGTIFDSMYQYQSMFSQMNSMLSSSLSS